MLKKFKTFQLAAQLYRETRALRLPRNLADQLERASSSVALNLAEGYGRQGVKDRKRFYDIAAGSLREVQAILFLATNVSPKLIDLADHTAASLWRLQQKS